MAHRSALTAVMAQQIPVMPQKGELRQPAYFRSKRSVQTSGRLKAFQSCVAGKLSGTHPANRAAVRSAFASAAKGCAGK